MVSVKIGHRDRHIYGLGWYEPGGTEKPAKAFITTADTKEAGGAY